MHDCPDHPTGRGDWREECHSAVSTDQRELEASEGMADAERVSLVDWMRSLPHTSEVRACRVRIRGKEWEGVEYWQSPNPLDAEPAPAARRLYLLGNVPPVERRGNVAYRFEGDGRDWYLAGYFGQVGGRGILDQAGQSNEYHPYGAIFQLFAWDHSDGRRIDSYEERPYKRVPAKLDYPVRTD